MLETQEEMEPVVVGGQVVMALLDVITINSEEQEVQVGRAIRGGLLEIREMRDQRHPLWALLLPEEREEREELLE
jgi:hypothetical protein